MIENSKQGFTLLELLIVIAILAILATIVILVINPTEAIKKTRDVQRISDLDTLKAALLLYITEGNTDIGAGTCTSTPVCYSNLCKGDTCSGGHTPSENNGEGWIPINFTNMAGGSLLSHLPVDPVNTGTGNTYRYSYVASSTDFELDADMESSYYTDKNTVEINDGGDNTSLYEAGTKLDIITTWVLNETNCNTLTGWHWYITNGRVACWSKTLADSVSWNKGVSYNTRLTGSYTCTSLTTYDLQTRMEAAAAGKWYKVCSVISGHTMATNGTEDGQAGASYISALAIADCIDGTKDLSDCGGACTDWSTTNTWLRNWAAASGKSVLPYLATDAGTLQTDNDYWDACVQSGNEDQTLGCISGNNYFYRNRKACNDGDANDSWAAACGNSIGTGWDVSSRVIGQLNCSFQDWSYTDSAVALMSFRVVVRP